MVGALLQQLERAHGHPQSVSIVARNVACHASDPCGSRAGQLRSRLLRAAALREMCPPPPPFDPRPEIHFFSPRSDPSWAARLLAAVDARAGRHSAYVYGSEFSDALREIAKSRPGRIAAAVIASPPASPPASSEAPGPPSSCSVAHCLRKVLADMGADVAARVGDLAAVKEFLASAGCAGAGPDGVRCLQFAKMEVEGFGRFLRRQEFNLCRRGLMLVTAAPSRSFCNGLGKTTLSVTTLLWCLTGKLDRRNDGTTPSDVKHFLAPGAAAAEVKISMLYDQEPFYVVRRCTAAPRREDLVAKLGDGEELHGHKAEALLLSVFGAESVDRLRDLLLQCVIWTPFSGDHLLKNGKLSSEFNLSPGSAAFVRAKDLLQEASKAAKREESSSRGMVCMLEKELAPGAGAADLHATESRLSAMRADLDQCDGVDDQLGSARSGLAVANSALGQIRTPPTELSARLANLDDQIKAVGVERRNASETARESTCSCCGQDVDEATRGRLECRLRSLSGREQGLRQQRADAKRQCDELCEQETARLVQERDALVACVQSLTAKSRARSDHLTKLRAAEIELERMRAIEEDRKNRLEAARELFRSAQQRCRDAKLALVSMEQAEILAAEALQDELQGECHNILKLLATPLSTLAAQHDDAACPVVAVPPSAFQIRFSRPSRAAKSKKLLSKVEVVVDGEQHGRPVSTLSFSEYARLRLALFLSASAALQKARGLSVDLAVLDECFAGMDAYGVFCTLEVLRMRCRSSPAAAAHATILVSSAFDVEQALEFVFDGRVVIEPDGDVRDDRR